MSGSLCIGHGLGVLAPLGTNSRKPAWAFLRGVPGAYCKSPRAVKGQARSAGVWIGPCPGPVRKKRGQGRRCPIPSLAIAGKGQGRARHLGLMVMSRRVIEVLLTMAPLTFLTSKLPLSLFTFFFLTIFLPFLVSRSLKVSVRPGGTLTTAAANVICLCALAYAPGPPPSLRALARTVRLTWLVHEVLGSCQVSRTPQVLA